MELCIYTYTPWVLAAKQLIEKTCRTRSCKTRLVNPEIMRNYRLVSCNFWIHEHYKWDTTSLLLFSEGEGMRNQTADAERKSLVNYLRALHIWKESWGNPPKTQRYRKQSQICSMGGPVAHGSEISSLGEASTGTRSFADMKLRSPTQSNWKDHMASGAAICWPHKEE